MSELSDCFIQVGSTAPAFKGQAVVGNEFAALSYENGVLTLGDEKITGNYTVLFFYPLDFTFVCPTEILAFNEKIKEAMAHLPQVNLG